MKKLVKAPSVGRIVLFGSAYQPEDPLPAIVVDVKKGDPSQVCLCVCDERTYHRGENPFTGWVKYGEGKEDCWWWPPRNDDDFEVEVEEPQS